MTVSPDPAEVRGRTGPCHTIGCGHTKAEHGAERSPNGRLLPGWCLVPGCSCFGWDPMTGAEWSAVMAAEARR